MNKILKRVLCPVLLLGSAAAFLPGCLANKVIFQPPRNSAYGGGPLLKLEIDPDIVVTMRYLPSPSPDGYVILYSHGNAEDLSRIEDHLCSFVAHGYGIAAYDYEGYGQSSGSPSENNAYRDIDRAYRFLIEEAKIPPQKIIIYGRSVGSGPSCYLAEKTAAAALVLEAPFTSAFSVAGLGWLPGDKFQNIDRIGHITMPVLIIHGDNDSIIPQSHGRRLYESANESKEFYSVPGAGHNNIHFIAGDAYWKTLAAFLAKNTER